jgi:hypothetical protein
MNMIADLATTSLLYFVLMIVAVAYRFAGKLTEGKPWYPKSDHSYHDWYEMPYEWTNMLARALTGFTFVFCVMGWLSVLLTYKSGQPLQYHFGLVFKWSLLAGILDVVYCITYNIWLIYNRPGMAMPSYDIRTDTDYPELLVSIRELESGGGPMSTSARVSRRLSRRNRKVRELLKRSRRRAWHRHKR